MFQDKVKKAFDSQQLNNDLVNSYYMDQDESKSLTRQISQEKMKNIYENRTSMTLGRFWSNETSLDEDFSLVKDQSMNKLIQSNQSNESLGHDGDRSRQQKLMEPEVRRSEPILQKRFQHVTNQSQNIATESSDVMKVHPNKNFRFTQRLQLLDRSVDFSASSRSKQNSPSNLYYQNKIYHIEKIRKSMQKSIKE